MLWYPVEAVRRLQAEVPVPRGPDGRRQLQRRRVRALPRSARAGRPAAGRLRQDRLARPTTRRGSRSTAATRSSSTTARTASRRRRGRSTTSTRTSSADIGEPRDGRVERLRDRGRRPDTTRSRRNGEVINEFENTPGQDVVARRATRRRACGSSRTGYVGLQNHGGRGHDAVPRRPGRGPVGRRARAQPDRARSRCPGSARTRSRSARSTRRATSRPSRRSTSRSAAAAPGGAVRATVPPAADDTPATFRLGGLPRRISAKRFAQARAVRADPRARAR